MSLDRDYESSLLARARSGTLSEVDIASVVDALTTRAAEVDVYTLLMVVELSERIELASLVASFVEYPRDSQVSALAVQILLPEWELYDQYAHLLPALIAGRGWDDYNDVRDSALSAAGEAIRRSPTKHHRLMAELIGTVTDLRLDDLTRQQAYFALLRALGRDWAVMPTAARAHPLDELIEEAVLDEARHFERSHRPKPRR